jgi:hypothetical protein
LPLALKDGDAVTDIGSGPLTLAMALWMSRPDLRRTKLEFRCIDQTGVILDAGKTLFTALRQTGGDDGAWTIKTIHGELRRNGTLSTTIRGNPAALVSAVNVFNELAQDISASDPGGLRQFAAAQGRLLSSLADNAGAVLVLEPGVPRSGEFISLLRESLLEKNRPLSRTKLPWLTRPPLSPCTHNGPCPLPGGHVSRGGKEKWCHFAFDTEDAPAELLKLSAAAGIPKERAVLSFLLAGPVLDGAGVKTGVRIISDAFPVGNRWGRYACSEKGLVLAAGTKAAVEDAESGSLLNLALSSQRDGKSGAIIGELG